MEIDFNALTSRHHEFVRALAILNQHCMHARRLDRYAYVAWEGFQQE